MNFGGGPPYGPPYNAYNTGMPMFPQGFPGMMPPVTNMPANMPGAMPGQPLATSYPAGQGPLAGRTPQRGANGLYEAPEPEGPSVHEARQHMKLNPGEEVRYGEYWAQACGDEEQVSGRDAVTFMSRASRVSKGQLRRIWDIADHRKEGSLGRDEFYIALRLLALAQRGAELSVAGLRNFTGIQLIPDIAPEIKEIPDEAEPAKAEAEGFSWTVKPEVVARYDAFFKTLDVRKMGMIDGKQGVTFFGKSGLPRPTLQRIWQLADVTRDGMLSLEEFRSAMHMVTNIRNKKLTSTALPSALDPSGPNWLRIEGQEPPRDALDAQTSANGEAQSNPAEQQPDGQSPVMMGMPGPPLAMPPVSQQPASPHTQSRGALPGGLSLSATSPQQQQQQQQPVMVPPMTQQVQSSQPDYLAQPSLPQQQMQSPMPPQQMQPPMPPQQMQPPMPPQQMQPLSPPQQIQPPMPRQHLQPAIPQQQAHQSSQSDAQNDETQRMLAELRKEKAEIERARREMEEMKAEMEKMRLEKASMASLPAMAMPMAPQTGLGGSTQGYEQSQGLGSVQPVGLAGGSVPLPPPMRPDVPSPPVAPQSQPIIPGTSANERDSGGTPPASIRTQPISLGNNDDDDIWDQPSPKASALPGPGAGDAKKNAAQSNDSVSSDDDDDFWGGMGSKPTLGPAGGQKPGASGTGNNGAGFGGSELDDWVF